jgi:hypothetical protein
MLGDLSWRSGLFPSRPRTLAPEDCLPCSDFQVFGVCYHAVNRNDPRNDDSALPPGAIHEALPK